MTDLQINIALAKAMGWYPDVDVFNDNVSGYIIMGDFVKCWDVEKWRWRKFDYRDPVIFVAICERWKLAVDYFSGRVIGDKGVCRHVGFGSMRKVAALVVIELEGVRL